MALTVYTRINSNADSTDPDATSSNFKFVGRYVIDYECSMFIETLCKDSMPAWYIKLKHLYFKLPRSYEDIGTVPLCSQCPNQLRCLAFKDNFDTQINTNPENRPEKTFKAFLEQDLLYLNNLDQKGV